MKKIQIISKGGEVIAAGEKTSDGFYRFEHSAGVYNFSGGALDALGLTIREVEEPKKVTRYKVFYHYKQDGIGLFGVWCTESEITELSKIADKIINTGEMREFEE